MVVISSQLIGFSFFHFLCLCYNISLFVVALDLSVRPCCCSEGVLHVLHMLHTPVRAHTLEAPLDDGLLPTRYPYTHV